MRISKSHIRKALLIGPLLVIGCAGIEPYEPRDYREVGMEKGLLTGSEGEFVIYRKADAPETDSEVGKRLELTPVVPDNNAPLRTAFVTPVDISTAKTGITASERSETIRRIASTDCVPEDFVRPGHVYPLIAKKGGVLRRAGTNGRGRPTRRHLGHRDAGAT